MFGNWVGEVGKGDDEWIMFFPMFRLWVWEKIMIWDRDMMSSYPTFPIPLSRVGHDGEIGYGL